MLDGLAPQFRSNLDGLFAHASRDGISLRPLSGYRSEDDQRRAIQQVAQRNGIPFHEGLYQTGIKGMAAPVGRSQHQHGSAMDWDVTDPATKRWLYENAPQYGFRFPLPNSDSGHMELGGPREASSPAPQPQGPAPMASYAQPDDDLGILGRFIKGLNQTVSSPLFQMGAGMVNAGARGTNFGGGILEGGQAAAAAAQQQAALAKAERERQAQMQRDRLWAQLGSAGIPGMPKEHMALASMLPPDEGVKFLTSVATKNAEGSIERDKLAETKRYHDLMDVQNRQREEDMRAMRASQSDSAAAVAELRREQTARMKREAEQEEALFGRKPAPAPVPSPQSGPGYAPNVRPQSFEGEPDPNLIRVQEPAPAAPAPVPQARAPQQPMIKVPQSARFPQGMATPDEATAFAQELLTTEKFKPLGQQILKQVEQMGESRSAQKGTLSKLEEKIANESDHLSTLNRIVEEHGPNIRKYQSWGFRGKQVWNGIIDATTGNLNEKALKENYDYTRFRATSAHQMNTVIKAMLGSAVTASEAGRILLELPNAGDGGWTDVFNGDKPNQYIAKLNTAIESSKAAIARAAYLRNLQGWTPEQIAAASKLPGAYDVGGVSLQGIKSIMGRELGRYERTLRQQNPNAPDDAIRDQVIRYRKEKFDI